MFEQHLDYYTDLMHFPIFPIYTLYFVLRFRLSQLINS